MLDAFVVRMLDAFPTLLPNDGLLVASAALEVESSTVSSATDCFSASIFDELSNIQVLHVHPM